MAYLRLDQLDPREDFFLYKVFECNVDKAVYGLRAKQLCPAFEIPEGPMKALNYTKGGTTLDADINAAAAAGGTAFPLVLAKLSNVMRGIALLNKNQRYHFDVKELNVLTHNYRYKLIDFGLSTTRSRIKFDPMYATIYRYWQRNLIRASSGFARM